MCFFSFNAQIISQFSWDDASAPTSQADIGPNFSTISTSSTISSPGAGGTNGLNAGLPKQDLNFILSDNPIFNVKGLDFSIDYQRDESVGSFLRRGSSLLIGGGNQFSVTYRIDDGAGGFTTVSSGNIYAIPNDNTFRTYRFVYLPTTGVGTLMVNGVVEWTNDGPDNREMYWVGSGNLEFGNQMDGSGSNRAFFDNLIIGEVTSSPLPIELIHFEAKANNDHVLLDWETASEIDNDYFTIEKSKDSEEWVSVNEVKGAGTSSNILTYNVVDYYPYSGVSYYRLKQTDFNGEFSYSKIRSVEINIIEKQSIKLFPNPSSSQITLLTDEINNVKIFNSLGQEIYLYPENNFENEEVSFDVSRLKNGIYFIKTESHSIQFIKN